LRALMKDKTSRAAPGASNTERALTKSTCSTQANMADHQGKHSPSGAQGIRPSAQASSQPGPQPDPKPGEATKTETQPSAMTKRDEIIARYHEKRRFYRFNEVEGKTLNFVEVHLAGDHYAIDIHFQDHTTLHFVIERSLSVYTEYADWQSGKGDSIKRWPVIRGAGFRT
jgi:hypothetical protein